MPTISRFLFLLLLPMLLYSQSSETEKVSELFKYEQESHKQNSTDYEKALSALRTLKQVPGDDAKVLECLRINRIFQKIESAIRTANNRQVELISLLNTMSKRTDLMPQEVTYLNHYRQKIKEIGMEQDTILSVIQSRQKVLRQEITAIPAPATFINRAGISMRLFGKGKNACYISEFPISEAVFQGITAFGEKEIIPENRLAQTPHQGGITFTQCQSFCQTLSKFEGYPYSVPERQNLAFAQRANHIPEIAVWCATPWVPDWQEEETLKRFAVQLFTVWDPKRLISGSQKSSLSGDVKFAAYPQLGFLVKTPVSTGRRMRVLRIEAELLKNE